MVGLTKDTFSFKNYVFILLVRYYTSYSLQRLIQKNCELQKNLIKNLIENLIKSFIENLIKNLIENLIENLITILIVHLIINYNLISNSSVLAHKKFDISQIFT